MSEKKRKINFFDVVIIALVAVLCVAVLVIRSKSAASSTTAAQMQTLQYTIELNAVPDQMSDAIAIGDSLTEGVKNYNLGNVVDVQVEAATDQTPIASEGRYVEKEIPEMEKIFLTVEAQVTESDSSFAIDGAYVVRAGNTVSVKGPGYAWEGMVVSVNRGEA